MSKKFSVGDVVRHDFSSEIHGTVTEVRDEKPYTTYVKWDERPQRNDWFDPEVLLLVRGATGGVLVMEGVSISGGARGVLDSQRNIPVTRDSNVSEGSSDGLGVIHASGSGK